VAGIPKVPSHKLKAKSLVLVSSFNIQEPEWLYSKSNYLMNNRVAIGSHSNRFSSHGAASKKYRQVFISQHVRERETFLHLQDVRV
jgi:hypothetical protein